MSEYIFRKVIRCGIVSQVTEELRRQNEEIRGYKEK